MPDIAAGGSLVERILQGDRSAEEELVQQYWRRVFLIVRARIRNRNPEEAYDLTQNTFVVVLQAIRADKLREPEKLVAFIHGVASNLTKNFLCHEVETYELDQEVPSRDPVELLEAADRQRKAQQAINSLSAVDQQILLGVLVDGASLEEIAKRLNMSPESVRARKSRAIKKLKKKFGGMSHI
jgi:RNA polymerase sigma-70 factor (ECF subfamily)